MFFNISMLRFKPTNAFATSHPELFWVQVMTDDTGTANSFFASNSQTANFQVTHMRRQGFFQPPYAMARIQTHISRVELH